MQKPWYEALYENFEDYDSEAYVQSTKAEIDFIEKNLRQDNSIRILDVGCGTGRHTLELSHRGHQVCGLDLSEEMLALGRKKAQKEGLEVDFVQGDARYMAYDCEFDAVVILCEGGFSLVETDEMDRLILAGAAHALKPGGKLFMTSPSAAFMFSNQKENENFNPITQRETFLMEADNANGEKINLHCSQRYYTFSEVRSLLREVGFENCSLFAVMEDGYSGQEDFSVDQFEFGVMAIKKD